MDTMRKYFFAALIFILFLIPGFAAAESFDFQKIFYLASWNAVPGVESLNKNWQEIDILAPQYHSLNADFSITGGFGPKLKKAIKDHNLKVMPLIVNRGFSQKIIHNLLLSSKDQDKVINYLVKGALTNGYIGWQFDFENINYKDKDLYTAFVQKAYKLFQKNNLILSVAVVSRTSDFEDTEAFKNWGGVYDYEKIAESSDFITLMAYDDPNSVGPTASLDFVENALAYVKDKIPAEKLSLGVPLYSWKWNLSSSKRIGTGLFKNLLTIMENFSHTLGFDNGLGAGWLTYSYNKKNYAVWFENRQSFELKLDIVKENRLRGFSAWLLGNEDPAIWNIL